MKTLIILAALILVTPAFAQSAWEYSTKEGIDGTTTHRAIALPSDDFSSLVIRCKNTCEAYISLDRNIAAEQDTVHVKFNGASLKSFAVNRGEGGDSLFFKSPLSLIKAIRDNGGYVKIEYQPYGRTATVATFGIWNLPPAILARLK